MIAVIIAVSVVIFILLACFAISLYSYIFAFYSSEKGKKKVLKLPHTEQYAKVKEKTDLLLHEINELPYEQVFIDSFDGTLLAARYYHISDDAPLQIQFHGYRGSALRDFCGGNKLAREAGFNILAVDQRAHGKSGGHTITFGVKERYDCLSWIEYARSRFGDKPIVLAGISMGASTVLMAAGLSLPSSVRGIIADCPYTSPPEIIRKVCRDRKLPPSLVYPFIDIGAMLFGHFRLNSASAVEAVKQTSIPILLIHGEADLFVPCEMSSEIAKANKNIERVTFPEAGHGLSYVVDPEGYSATVEKFLKKIL